MNIKNNSTFDKPRQHWQAKKEKNTTLLFQNVHKSPFRFCITFDAGISFCLTQLPSPVDLAENWKSYLP